MELKKGIDTMKFSTLPPKGTFDVLPNDMELRNYVKDVIRHTYISRGFNEIETPMLENIDLMTNSDGGENLRLIFKILKRGEKLELGEGVNPDDLCDLALRFDLTLPLSRYYAKNRNELENPFKAFQMGYVFRAERPQKGRYRQFIQSDIDIIGDDSIFAEITILKTVALALGKLGFSNSRIKINDRRLLREIIEAVGLDEIFETVCISLDKLDKIGEQGVKEELIGKGVSSEKVEILLTTLTNLKTKGLQSFDSIYAKELAQIIEAVGRDYNIEFEPSLVRGMGYYTGPIFEIVSDEFGSSIAGGGRYDNLLTKFQKESIPAVGMSIGFERIIQILKDRGFQIPGKGKKVAILVGEYEKLEKAEELAQKYIEEGHIASIFSIVGVNPNKISKKISAFTKQGFHDVIVVQ
ncbi:histidine--tRNA ligase [Anaerobranca gottschalkii]|uniref:Histidine--tRNA ligase n=1 Tax=Anaerobranca gottschalkii DSM 13577 TaxID=1120990 RepID=A0A1H9YI94_9FIRM|nr:histidine--tRNA ligase [Anaerobranca gottschalkii]SES68301.1 histidyl-tRNA synthetase [Anaerobranca gottschalkii DSM 13577]